MGLDAGLRRHDGARTLFIVPIIPSQVFSKELTKDTKGSENYYSELRALLTTIRDNLRGLRQLSGSRDASDSDIPRTKVAKVAK